MVSTNSMKEREGTGTRCRLRLGEKGTLSRKRLWEVFLGWTRPAGVIGSDMSPVGPELLGRLIDEHAAVLVLYARQWCAAPEDVVQDAFVKLVAQRSPPHNVAGWLYRVVRNGAISAARSARRRQHHETAAARRAPAWFATAEDAGLDAETAAEALRELLLDQREVIVAHLWGGLTFEQIAELTGSSASTAHRCYVAGLSALRERLGVACPPKPLSRG